MRPRRDIHIGYTQGNPRLPFRAILGQTVKARAEQLGVSLTSVPAFESAEQAAVIDRFIQQKVDVLLIGPVDSRGIVLAVERANAAGIPVVTVDFALDGGQVACTIGSDHVRGAELSAAYLVERLGGQGKIAHLHGPFTSQPGVQRMQGFHQVVDHCPGVQLVLEAGGEWTGEQAAQLTRQALAAHPDLRGIFAANDSMALGALAVLEAAGRAGQVMVVGFDAAPDALLAIHMRRLAATVRQSARAMGQRAVDTALQVARGERVPPLILTEVTLVTAENVVGEALDSLSLMPSVLRDLTKSSAALVAERNLLRTLIDHMPDYIYVKDTASRFVSGNIAVAQLMGAATPDDLIGKTDLDFYPPDLVAHYYADEQAIILTGQPLIDHEERVIDQRTGQPRWLSSTKVPLRDSEGNVIGLVGISRDITERKQAEEEIRRLNREANTRAAELDATMNAISEGLLAWSAQGVILHLNRPAGELLNLAPDTVVGRPLSEYIILPEGLAQAVARGEELSDVEISLPVNSVPCECLISLRIIRDGEGQPVTYIVTLRRIEQVRQLVTRLVGAQARLTLDDMVGLGVAARRVRRQALAAANAKACVLLAGESGTGKNVLARAIHNSGRRANGPFLAINCRAIPHELVLGEFLGFEAGAFGSASTGQPSKFELAQGGTLFLEEVEALPLAMQAALRRVIEANDVIRLGGTRVIPVDVRIIASTAVPLDTLLAEGAFRSDLLLRLSSIVIHTLPLRERQEDIPTLINRLLEKLSVQIGQTLTITPAASAALCAYPWPGNHSELESVMERAALACEGQPIQPEHLPTAVLQRRALTKDKRTTEPVHSLVKAEQNAILAAGRAARGNMGQAAQILGIARSTLWRKMKELDISVEDFR
jgi:transcriptional activator for dhaKLM operon